MISLPKNLEVTFLAEKKRIGLQGPFRGFVHHFPLKSSISDQIWLQMENRVFTKNLKTTWFLPIKVQISRKTS